MGPRAQGPKRELVVPGFGKKSGIREKKREAEAGISCSGKTLTWTFRFPKLETFTLLNFKRALKELDLALKAKGTWPMALGLQGPVMLLWCAPEIQHTLAFTEAQPCSEFAAADVDTGSSH